MQDVDIGVGSIAPLSNRWAHIFLSPIGKCVKIETFITKRTLATTFIEVLAVFGTIRNKTKC